MTETPFIVAQQHDWARKRGIACNGPGPETVAENLLSAVHPATWADFANGDGGELGTLSKPGKMRSLRSSSALALNVFDYWRYRPLAALVSALGLSGDYRELRFEQKLPTGLRGKRPNLDVALFQAVGPPAGIECKFCEPYDSNEMHPPLDDVYLTAGRDLWTGAQMPTIQRVAAELGHSFRPSHLAAGQLLKHLLGLGYTFANVRPVQLVYLWFDNGSPTATAHREEVAEFSSLIKSEVIFLSVTYQDLFVRLQRCGDVDKRYLSELRERYLSAKTTLALADFSESPDGLCALGFSRTDEHTSDPVRFVRYSKIIESDRNQISLVLSVEYELSLSDDPFATYAENGSYSFNGVLLTIIDRQMEPDDNVYFDPETAIPRQIGEIRLSLTTLGEVEDLVILLQPKS